MSSVDCLRGFINERLTAAAEEIFGVFQKTIFEYKEEIDRQRKLLDVWKPEIKLHRIELPQQRVCTEDEVLADQLLCKQERNSILDQEDPEPPQIKEEQEEPCSSQEEEQLVLKQETDTFMLIPPYEESDHNEPEPNSDQQLLSHNSHVAESQNQTGGKHGDSEPKKRPWKRHTNNIQNSAVSESNCNAHTAQKGFTCNTCGLFCKYKSKFVTHQRVHTGEKPFSCNTCGTRFTQRSALNTHIRLHSREKPFSCQLCGKGFRCSSTMSIHMRIHAGEKPYSCQICGKAFRRSSNMTVHMRNHTDDKLYPCDICGIKFNRRNLLKAHMRVHQEVVQ